MSEAVLVKGNIACGRDDLRVRVEPVRITDEVVKDPEFVKLIVGFIKKKYGYASVGVADTVDIGLTMEDIYRVDVYLEVYRAYPKGPGDDDDLKYLLGEI